MIEYEIIRDDVGGLEGKYAILKKPWKGAGWIVDEVEPGFASNDKEALEGCRVDC